MAELLATCAAVTWAEQGCGIVPIDAHDRAVREAAGRLGCELATRADVVVRMACGIPQVIKGTLPMGGSPCPRL
ncbi:MAG: bifunctional adenosylcobinamide kinase/adenosylcobinamide-phosphate guanylyltransferase [Coriobacteriia bacterium]|nr:bifunctional adenosylcobinamide kinase/adenosylcobinamide-phosphate guanylyltransferase [Coriobacteriia bacterium]MBS5477354.1 bifunctional adenosylcobinamide kinase/adenosylcobinamide-phosphate guanylyltransferase [Coriobacteriia bacterium]